MILLVCLLLVSISSRSHAAELVLLEGDAGEKACLRKGDMLTVKLPANPTTGYSWSHSFSRTSFLESLSNATYKPDKNDGGMVGGGGVEIWKFRAVRVGNLELHFSYARPWEHGIAPLRSISWSVVIKR